MNSNSKWKGSSWINKVEKEDCGGRVGHVSPWLHQGQASLGWLARSAGGRGGAVESSRSGLKRQLGQTLPREAPVRRGKRRDSWGWHCDRGDDHRKAKVWGKKRPGRVRAVAAGGRDDQRQDASVFKEWKEQAHCLIQTLLLSRHESKLIDIYKSVSFKLSELNSHWIYFFLRKVDSIL